MMYLEIKEFPDYIGIKTGSPLKIAGPHQFHDLSSFKQINYNDN